MPLVVLGQATGIGTVDAWWNFGLGRQMLDQHHLVVGDPFSFTPTAAGVINQQWLAQLAWAMAYQSAGAVGAFVLRGAAVAVTAIALWTVGRDLGASRRALVAATLVSAFLIATNLSVRAQTLAFPIAGLSLLTLQRGGRAQWLAVPLAMLWANVHGSFPLAVAFSAAFSVGSLGMHRRRAAFSYAVLTVVVALATVATPYGAETWRYAVDLSSNQTMHDALSEWGRTTLDTATGKAFYLVVAASISILALRRPTLPLTWLLLIGGLALFGMSAVRNVVWLGIVGMPVWALLLDSLSGSFADHPTQPRVVRLMLAALFAIALVPLLPANVRLPLAANAELGTGDQEQALAALTDYLVEHPGGHLFNDADWGAYLEAHLTPGQLVFIDTRFEVHPTSVWDDYFAVLSAGSDWQMILDSYNVDTVAIDPLSAPMLAAALDAARDWHQVFRTTGVVVWQRTARGG